QVMKNPSRSQEVMHRLGDVFVDGAIDPRGIHDGLLVIHVLIQRQEEGGLPTAGERAAQRAFVELATFSRLRSCILVGSVEQCVTKHKVGSAVKVGGSALGDNLEPCSTRPGKLCRIGILVDPDFLDSRRGDTRSICLYAVYDQGDAVGA